MHKIYEEIITTFVDKASKIPGVYDLLLRGSIANNVEKQNNFVEYFSDLDFSIIVTNLNQEVRHSIRNLYQKLINNRDIKITITIVDTTDFFSTLHCHGIRPIYYSQLLSQSKSLLRGDISYAKKEARIDRVVIMNCFANVSYLVHDLRKQHMEYKNDESEINLFTRHLVKRTKHIIRNAITVFTGYISEEICERRLREYLPKVDPQISQQINWVKDNWHDLKNNKNELLQLVNYMFDNLEQAYLAVIEFVNREFRAEDVN